MIAHLQSPSATQEIKRLDEGFTAFSADKKAGVHSEKRYHDLDHLFGQWSKAEADAFDEYLKIQRRIDPKMWE